MPDDYGYLLVEWDDSILNYRIGITLRTGYATIWVENAPPGSVRTYWSIGSLSEVADAGD